MPANAPREREKQRRGVEEPRPLLVLIRKLESMADAGVHVNCWILGDRLSRLAERVIERWPTHHHWAARTAVILWSVFIV